MLNRALEFTLTEAVREAQRRRHEYICVEHLLYALCNDPYGREILLNCGGDVDSIRRSLELFFEQQLPKIPTSATNVPHQTPAFERVLQHAIEHVRFSGKQEVDAGDVLAAMFEEDNLHAVHFLRKEGITRLDILEYISHGIAKTPLLDDDDLEDDLEDLGEDEEEGQASAPARDPLEAYTVNLVERAAQGKIDPLIGRGPELTRISRVLCRRRKNNPILVGEPGVGKTAIVEGLARSIHLGEAPTVLLGYTILRLDLAAMLAGTKFRGDFEQRLKGVIGALSDREDVILFIDEIHTLVGAGSTSDSTIDASSMLKPVLASGDLRCIGATTYEEYKNIFEKDRALSRRFQKIEVEEPSVDDTVRILKGLRSRYESFHGIRYTEGSLRAAAELAAKHINDRFLPDKAIDVLDEAGSCRRLAPRNKGGVIRTRDIELIVAEIAKTPIRSITASDRDMLARLEEDLKRAVFGQDEGIHALATAIKRSRAGLGQLEAPVGSFLFTGPTGVGKTEVARQLAQVMGIHFARYDMSEYMEKHSVSRLIGAPPGYVGFDQGGLLTDEVRRHPHSVLLLDEIEKAHSDLFSILLQVMDRAALTDHNGKKADFRNVILIMTSNAGARDWAANAIGFAKAGMDAGVKDAKAVERTFSPEFRNRIDAIIHFNPLTPAIMGLIVDKFMGELRARLTEKGLSLEVEPEARVSLSERGFDPKYGARPLRRLIQVEVHDKLSDMLLFSGNPKGGVVYIGHENNTITVRLRARQETHA